jgi:multiple sugar transport system permease protein
MKRLVPQLGLNLILFLAAVVTLAPLAWMVSASLMATGEARLAPLQLLPDRPTLEQYRLLFTRLDMSRHLLNSTVIASSLTVLSVVLNGMAGFAFAKLHFAGRDRLFRMLLGTLVIPTQVAILPLFLMLKQMGLINSYAAIILPGAASIYGVFLVRQYAVTMPDELLEAARIDGAGEWRIFWAMVVPSIRPVLSALAIFTFLTAWNDFLWPLVVLTDHRMYTLPVALATLSGDHVQETELLMAGAVVTILPTICLFMALQRQLIGGIMMGSVKG